MLIYYTSEPCIRSMNGDSSGFANYVIGEVTGMQDDQVQATTQVYVGTAYCPDGHEDIDFMPMLRSMIDNQVHNLSFLSGWNSQACILMQSTFAYNTYFSVTDLNNNYTEDYSIVYDTRGITTYEADVTTMYHTSGRGYSANLYPDPNILHGQYFNLTYRNPSNMGEMTNYTFGFEYAYVTRAVPSDPELTVLERHIIDSSVTGQSFRYCGTADWQDWGEGNGNILWGRFYIYQEKEGYRYLTPKLYPKWCDDPDTVYLYWLNSLGGIEFVRGKLTDNIEHEDSTYETNATIEDYHDGWGQAVYSQRKWHSYTFGTGLVTDGDSPAVADVCGARFAWLYFPGRVQPWKTVKVNDAKATVKTFRNQGGKLFNYTWELEDSVKAKTV